MSTVVEYESDIFRSEFSRRVLSHFSTLQDNVEVRNVATVRTRQTISWAASAALVLFKFYKIVRSACVLE